MSIAYEDYEHGKRAFQIGRDADIALGAFKAFIQFDEMASVPGYAADDSLTAARDSIRASAADDMRAHLELLADVANEAGLQIGYDLQAAADRLQALYDATASAKRVRANKDADARFRVLANIVRPLGTTPPDDAARGGGR